MKNLDERPIINLTMHQVNIVDSNNRLVKTIPSSGMEVRVRTEHVQRFFGAPVVRFAEQNVEGLPPERFDDEAPVYIVSSLVLIACKNRRDLISPDTGKTALRDEQRKVIGVRRFRGN